MVKSTPKVPVVLIVRQAASHQWQESYPVGRELSQLEDAPRHNIDSEPNYDEDYGLEVYGNFGPNYPF